MRDEEIADPFPFCTSSNRWTTWAWEITSSMLVGSSNTTSFGCISITRARASRCSSPPESSPGIAPQVLPVDAKLGEEFHKGIPLGRGSAGTGRAPLCCPIGEAGD